jgi:hypothetical protein
MATTLYASTGAFLKRMAPLNARPSRPTVAWDSDATPRMRAAVATEMWR